jgi:uncharacterized protein DUF6898
LWRLQLFYRQSGAGQMTDGEVLFEFVQVGPQMRVAAIHVLSGTEVVVITPVSATRTQMQQVALAKLRKKLGNTPPPPAPERRRF